MVGQKLGEAQRTSLDSFESVFDLEDVSIRAGMGGLVMQKIDNAVGRWLPENCGWLAGGLGWGSSSEVLKRDKLTTQSSIISAGHAVCSLLEKLRIS